MKQISKTELMRMVLAGTHHESFEHSFAGMFDVTLTREWAIKNLQPVFVPLANLVGFIMQNRVTEPARVMQLKDVSWRVDPGIAIEFPPVDGAVEHLMIDGHHRALRRNIEGETDMPMYIVPVDKAVRPQSGWYKRTDVDWGDKIVDGVIQRGDKS